MDEKGCISSGRTESKAFISNPILTSTFEELCIGETASLTIENIAKQLQILLAIMTLFLLKIMESLYLGLQNMVKLIF